MSSTNRAALIATWLFALAISGGVVFYLEVYGLFSRDGIHIASLAEARGDVQYRPGDISSWYNVLDEQIFFEGDRLSTGFGSTAILKFVSGQELEIDENTQIEIRQNEENNEELNITLLKGYITASGSKKSSIVIKAKGGKEYRLSGENDEVCISRYIGKKGALECLKKDNKVSLKKKKFIKMAALTPSIVVPDIQVEEEPSLPEAKNFMPQIFNAPRNGSIAWTAKSFRSKSVKWPVILRPPNKSPNIGIWFPLIEVLDGNGNSRNTFVTGKARFKKQKIELSISQIKKVATRNLKKIPPEYSFSYKAGGKISDDKSNSNQEISKKKYSYSIRSLDEVPAGDIELGLLNANKKSGSSTWFYQKKEITVSEAKLKISLASKSDLKKLTPFMRTGSFYLKRGNRFKGKRIFIARKMEIVASLSGRVTKSAAVNIRKLLDADFIYRGDKASFFKAKNKNSKDFEKWVSTLIKSGGKVYVMRDNKFYPISRKFLVNSNQVLSFVGRNATYVFDKKVEILDSRPGL